MNTASLSATMALACKAADGQSSSKNLNCSIWSTGIAKVKRTGSASRAASLGNWLELVLHLYGERGYCQVNQFECLLSALATL